MRRIARFLGFVFATGAIVFVILAAGVVAAVVWKYEQDLPDFTQLKNYEPPVMTRVHAADGSLLAEYSRERRSTCPPPRFRSSSRRRSFPPRTRTSTRTGASTPKASFARASVFLQGSHHVQGASTITQQVAKNFLLS